MAIFYCPQCLSPLQVEIACGSESYFCPECKGLVSRKKILDQEAMEALKAEKEAQAQA